MNETLKSNSEVANGSEHNQWETAMADAPSFQSERVEDVEKARAMASVENAYRNKAAHIDRLAKRDRKDGMDTNADNLDRWHDEVIDDGQKAAEKEGKFYDRYGHGFNDKSVSYTQDKRELSDPNYRDLAPKIKPEDINYMEPGKGYN